MSVKKYASDSANTIAEKSFTGNEDGNRSISSSLFGNNVIYGFLNMSFLRQVEKNLQGSDQPYINLPPLKKCVVNICSLEEQKQIVTLLRNLITKEELAKHIAEVLIERMNDMKKSILAKAFRGELGTNDPTEPPVEIA